MSCIGDGWVWLLHKAFSRTSQRFSMGLRSWICGGQIHVWKWCLVLSEPLFHNVNSMYPGIVILKYAHVIREEKKSHWWNKPCRFFCCACGKTHTFITKHSLYYCCFSSILFQKMFTWLVITITLNFFLAKFLHWRQWVPTILPVMRPTVLNPILVISAFSFDVFLA